MPNTLILGSVPECIVVGVLLDLGRYMSERNILKRTRAVVADFSQRTKTRRHRRGLISQDLFHFIKRLESLSSALDFIVRRGARDLS